LKSSYSIASEKRRKPSDGVAPPGYASSHKYRTMPLAVVGVAGVKVGGGLRGRSMFAVAALSSACPQSGVWEGARRGEGRVA